MGPFRDGGGGDGDGDDDRGGRRRGGVPPDSTAADVDVDSLAVGAVAAAERAALSAAAEFGTDDDDDEYDSGDGDGDEYEALRRGSPPRTEPREQIRRTLLSGAAVLLGCAAFVYVTVTAKRGAQLGEGTVGAPSTPLGDGSPAPEPVAGGDGRGDDDGDDDDVDDDDDDVDDGSPRFRISPETDAEFAAWSEELRKRTGLADYAAGEPPVDWSLGHPRRRRDRFPSARRRIEYYMGRWHDPPSPPSVEARGDDDFLRRTWGPRRTTRRFGISSSFVVNLFDFDVDALLRCDAEEKTVLHAYCRDYVDFAILHRDMSAGAIQHMGDSLPRTSPNKKIFGAGAEGGGYPVFNKVRNYCDVPPERLRQYAEYFGEGDVNPNCRRDDRIDTILWPLNRHRHFTPAARLNESDVPWDEKIPKAIWRGGTNDAFASSRGDRKWALVSRSVNSTLVDAKFAERGDKRGRHGDRTEGIPEEYLGPFVDQSVQLRHKYLISIEGNDVSSGLKWMLFSNSLVMLPPTTFESWAMEGLLEPYVHYLPLKSDMSDIESQILWAESHPADARRIAERSTLFIYDLLFHPDAPADERAALRGIAERYEENFGRGGMTAAATATAERHPIGWVRRDVHPERREDRFLSAEERARYCMGRWWEGASADMGRDAFEEGRRKKGGKGKERGSSVWDLHVEPRPDGDFVASGEALSRCAAVAAAADGDLARLCADALPFFDERLVHDIVSTRHPDESPSFRLAPETEDMSSSEKKWYKRILIDDSVKVLRFGEGAAPSAGERTDVPVFAGTRGASPTASLSSMGGGVGGGGRGTKKKAKGEGRCRDEDVCGALTVLWRFGSSRGGDDGLVRSGLIERLDGPFRAKRPGAVWRGGFGVEGPPEGAGSDEFTNRLGLVKRSTDRVDARFVLPEDELRRNEKRGGGGVPGGMIEAEPRGEEELTEQLRHMLSFRYIVATEDDFRVDADLKWMLLSRSVVLAPRDRRFASWFMEDALEPYVHFVPIESDYADVEERIDWCEDHVEDAERIAERATLYVHDMLFDRRAAGDDDEVRLRIMERYAERFGGG